MTRLFAVIRTRAAGFDRSQPLEAQRDWRAHADFMNALVHEGFVVLGGPLANTPDVLLIVRAGSEQAIESRLAADPWSGSLLTIRQIAPWTLRLGSLDR